MKIKFDQKIREELQKLGDSKDIWVEGNLIKLLDDCEGEFVEYIETALAKDSDKRKKRLEITKQVQDQNKELQTKAEENESLMEELKEALKKAETAKEAALEDLDVLQKKSQFKLIGSIVSYALFVIVGTGIVTTGLYVLAILMNSSETTLIGNTWSNLFGILLTNSFSIIGTIMGVKYANRADPED